MAKLGIDKDTIKRFFSLHVEKIVLAVVVGLLVLFVYRGYSLEGLASAKRPDKLKASAASVQQYLADSSVVPEIVAMHKPETGFVGQTKAGQAPINSLVFDAPLTPSPPVPSGTQRTDPAIFPPEEVEATPLSWVSIAYRPVAGDVDPFKDDENMTPKKAEVKKSKRPKRKKRDKNDPYGGAMGGLSGESGTDEGGLGGLAGIPGMSGDSGAGGAAGMTGMGGYGAGGYGAGAGAGGMLSANPADIEGYRPAPGAIVITKHIVGVTALVPYKRQWDEFEATLSTAMGYTRSRDVPTYLGFYAERAEVTDETDTDFKWVAISNSDFVVKRMQARQRPYGGWAGFPQEIADPRYVSPNVLTMPIPPVVGQSFEKISLHSKVPKFQVATRAPVTEENPDLPDEPGVPDEIGSAPSLTGATTRGGYGAEGGVPGMGGYGAESGAPGMGGMSGMSGAGGQPGMPGGTDMGGYGEEGGGGYGAPGMPGGMDMGGYGEEGGGGYGTAGMGGVPTVGPSVDYLMVRFFDLSVRDTTKKYRYRVQLWVEDPNHPKNAVAEPNVRALNPEVRARITDIKAKEAAAKNRLSYFRLTEFSEPSAVVSFESSGKTLGGEIAKERESVIDDAFGNQFRMPVAERSAKVMSVVFDTKRSIEVPGLIDAHRGTFLNFVMDADVVHPVSLQYKTIKEYAFRTNRMVLDFMGGQALPVPEEEEESPLYAPAEFLFLNEKGELFVKNELDDWDGFRKRMPPKPAATDDDAMGGDDDLPGMTGYGGEEGESDEGGRSGRGGRGGT